MSVIKFPKEKIPANDALSEFPVAQITIYNNGKYEVMAIPEVTSFRPQFLTDRLREAIKRLQVIIHGWH